MTAAMLTVTMPAMASHNSFGAPHTHVVDPDEFNAETGELVPDIPHQDHPNPERVDNDAIDETSVYNLEWHETLEEDGLETRSAPFDQSGDRYTDCNGPDAYGTDAEYKDALRTGDACYVGYMDQIVEHAFPTAPLIVTECPCDLLYPVNPSPDDRYCRGEEDTNEHTGVTPADETITNVERTTDDDCGTGQDNSFLTGDLLIDASLLEGGAAAAGEELGNDMGSGPFTLEGFPTTFTFLFGQPHPDNVAGDTLGDAVDGVDSDRELSGPSGFVAGEGPFGSDPADGGNPLHDLEGACGDRTQECMMLTPSDVILYDPWTWSEEFSDTPAPEQARVCAFLPQYSFSVAGGSGDVDRDQGVCGNTGERQDEFLADTEAGGFGVDEAPPTWFTNLPGWSWGVIFTTIPTDQSDQYATNYFDEELEHRSGFINYYAVNPIVPTREGDMRCLVPNILSHPDNSVLADNGVDTSEFEDPGVYGDYRADAIDVDVYPHPLRPQLEGVNEETHDEVRAVLGPAEQALDDVDQFIEENTGDLIPSEVEETVDAAQDRADYFESSETPAHAQLGPENQHPFEAGISAGIACDGANDLRFKTEEVPLDAGLRFQAGVSTQTVHLKDPTLLSDDGLPAPESETDEGYWQTDMYSFGGQIHGVIDFTQDGDFDSCPGANVNPGDDLCPWEGLWDAYSGDQCQNRDEVNCGELLDQRGYDIEKGVGAYFVLEVTGPTLVTSSPITTDVARTQQQTDILGDEGDPQQQNCLVGTTIGFHEKIPTFFDNAETTDDVAHELCDVDGEVMFVEDAFSSQSGVNPGGFSAQVSWAPLLPTPDESGFDQGDSLCVEGIWSTKDLPEQDYTSDTAGENNIHLEADGRVHTFSHWQSLETGTDTPDDRIEC